LNVHHHGENSNIKSKSPLPGMHTELDRFTTLPSKLLQEQHTELC
jgi:hypothetical protein